MGDESLRTCRNILQCLLFIIYVKFRIINCCIILFQLLCSVDPKHLKLTPFDDEIYKEFRLDFPDLDVRNLDESALKSPEGKVKWRQFIEKFNKLEDFSYGTLIRAQSQSEFTPDNSILLIRIQFLAIEIARNREGHNDGLRLICKPPERKAEIKT